MKKSRSRTANDRAGWLAEKTRLEAEIREMAAKARHAERHGNFESCHHEDLARLKAAWRALVGLPDTPATEQELQALTVPCEKC